MKNILLTLSLLSISSTFAAVNSVNSGEPISALKFNEVIEEVNQTSLNLEKTLPVGSVISHLGSSCPEGFLSMANGPAVSRETYSKLFSVIGTRFGAGNGTTTFNLPSRGLPAGVIGESLFTGPGVISRVGGMGPFPSTAALLGAAVSFSSMGTWLDTDFNVPRQAVNNLPEGNYRASFHFRSAPSSNTSVFFTINDGNSTCTATMGHDNASLSSGNLVMCNFRYTTSGNRQFELYTSSGATSHAQTPIRFQLEYSPLQTEASGNCIKH